MLGTVVLQRRDGRRLGEVAGGRRRARRSDELALVLGAAAALVAWVVLVGAAINFGQEAAAGRGSIGWTGTVLAGMAATLCLLAVFMLLGRLFARGVPWRSSAGNHRR